MFCFGFLEKNRKRARKKFWAHRAPTPQHGMPYHGKAEVPKMEPSDMPQRSFATPWQRATPRRSSATSRHRYCSQ